MKRYRFTHFSVDATRNIFRNFPAYREEIKQGISSKHGSADLDSKLERYLEFKPPNVTVVVDYFNLLSEIADSYVCGHYYPALTGACSLGERIFNMLILNLRDFYKDSPCYKNIYRSNSFQNWGFSINMLLEWKIIDSDLAKDYKKLGEIRNDSIHLKDLSNIHDKAINALRYIMNITDQLFGLRQNIFFFVLGEPYIRKNKEVEPIVKTFFIPNCTLVGYKHRIEEKSGQFVIEDANQYEEQEVTDEEFGRLRQQWRTIH
jgi:hypothetical protein